MSVWIARLASSGKSLRYWGFPLPSLRPRPMGLIQDPHCSACSYRTHDMTPHTTGPRRHILCRGEGEKGDGHLILSLATPISGARL